MPWSRLFPIVLVVLGVLLAGGDPIDRRLSACIDRDPTTAGMVRCSEEALQAWDQEMRRTLQGLEARLDPEARQRLAEAQRRWEAFRTAEEGFIRELYGRKAGTMYRPMEVGEVVDLVRQRTLRLRSYLRVTREE